MKKLTLFIISISAISLIAIKAWHSRQVAPPPAIVRLKSVSFTTLPGWKQADIKQSFTTFQKSCETFLQQNPDNDAGSQQIPSKVKDWQPACRAAIALATINDKTARDFFKTWFTPVEFYNNKPLAGLFTGYYLPLVPGSLVKTTEHNVPIYGLPDNIITLNPRDFNYQGVTRRIVGRLEGNKLVPFHTREDINKGHLKDKAPVLVWVKSHIDRLFLEIQGSGIIKLPNDETLFLGYAGENGAPYTPIGNVLVERGVMTKETASMQKIRAYLEANPQEILPVINKNKSFVFFRILNDTAAIGTQGISLTPGYSLAVDRKWIPLGAPLWLNTTRPDHNSNNAQPLQRLMIAQDTGGAIRGVVRGDVFWGAGEEATFIAGNMKNLGHYWLLLPKQIIGQLPQQFLIIA